VFKSLDGQVRERESKYAMIVAAVDVFWRQCTPPVDILEHRKWHGFVNKNGQMGETHQRFSRKKRSGH